MIQDAIMVLTNMMQYVLTFHESRYIADEKTQMTFKLLN